MNLTKKFIFGFILFFPIVATAQLKINEIMTNNASAVWDDSYNYSMWVELYNPNTTTSYNQSAYYFTDDLSQPRKWNPASKLIPAQGYNVLWFERDDRTGHANFKLEADGGKLYLLNSSAQIVDSVIYPKQCRNISYGRITDGSTNWVFFEQFSAGKTNNSKSWAFQRCATPVFNVAGGFYTATQNVSFANPLAGDTIYYTKNEAEPTRINSIRYSPGSVFTVSSTSCIRAKSFSAGRLSSDIATSTYFIRERNFHLPVVSVVTEPANLTDNTIGIYVTGTNGKTGNGSDVPVNWNQDWDRPVNFELFDSTGIMRLNQELDISISGGWSRGNPQKSFKISPRNKFGDNRLRYDIFAASKPNRKYKDIQLRNSGNDFFYSMMRDAFMQSLVMKRMNLDCLAYEPAVCFMNGVYYGIQNLREQSSKDFIFSNYGLNEDDVYLIESWSIPYDANYTPLSNYISNNDITQADVYNKVSEMMDIDNFMSYMISQIFFGNTDWPHNNVKIWKKKDGGKWRWILYDTDFGYNLYDSNLHNHNSLLYALGEKSDQVPDAWSTLLLRRLILNSTFRKNFIDRFCVQLSSTFEYKHSTQVLDSMAAKIKNEIVYHKSKWPSYRDFTTDINNMKTFANNRPANMLNFIGNRFLSAATTQTISVSSDNNKASYKFNDETITDPAINLKYFTNQAVSLEANPIPGYKFKQWETSGASSSSTLIANGSAWKYFDGNSIPANNWYSAAYSDASWKTGNAPLGYSSSGVVTTISYGTNSSNKNATAYFRKTFTISDLSSKNNFIISTFVDDGVCVYVNGTEVGRDNLPTGALAFSTLASTYNNGITATFTIPQNLLVEGENIIAVEVHQNSVTSSDLIFNLQLTYSTSSNTQIITTPVFNTTLTASFSIKAIYEQTIFEDPDKDMHVVINEVVSSNNLIQDEFGGKDDYIEIYNNGDAEVNIAGWYISDTPTNSTLVQIPTTNLSKTVIPSKGRIVLWADDEPEQGVLHLGFKLSKDGETLVLSKSNYLGTLVLVDLLSFPYLEQNTSYSRIPDGSETWKIVLPTCNLTNVDFSGTDETTVATRIYPTMVSDHLTIENAQNKTIRIFDLAGKMLLQHECYPEKETLQLGVLQKGIYILTIENENFKFIKL